MEHEAGLSVAEDIRVLYLLKGSSENHEPDAEDFEDLQDDAFTSLKSMMRTVGVIQY